MNKVSLWRRLTDYLHPAAIKRRLLLALSLGDPPEKIAMGVAVGVFLGVLPTFNLGLLLALAGSRLFKYNLAASIAGSAIATPLTSPFIIAASAAVGSLITGVAWSEVLEQVRREELWSAARLTAVTYMAGNLILCLFSALPAYFITKRAVVAYRQRQEVVR